MVSCAKEMIGASSSANGSTRFQGGVFGTFPDTKIFRHQAENSTHDGCAPQNQTERFFITSFLQLRESDLFAVQRGSLTVDLFGDRRSPLQQGASPSSHSSFCEEVFSLRIRETNEVDRTNILAPGLWCLCDTAPSSRLHPRNGFGDWPNGKSYPVTAAQLLPSLTGFLAPFHFSKLAKNWDED